MERIHTYEAELTAYLFQQLEPIPELRLYGPKSTATGRAALASFTAGAVHPHDLSTILDQSGVAIRARYHGTQPLHRYLKAPVHRPRQPLLLQHPRRNRCVCCLAEGCDRIFWQHFWLIGAVAVGWGACNMCSSEDQWLSIAPELFRSPHQWMHH